MWTPTEVSLLRLKGQQRHLEVEKSNQGNKNQQYKQELGVHSGSELLLGQGQGGPLTIETGCQRIDALLVGYKGPGLMSIAAEDGAIRSTVSLYIAINFLSKQDTDIFVIDSTGSFDVDKVLSIVQHQGGAASARTPSTQDIALLDRIHVGRVFDAEGLHQVMSELEAKMNPATPGSLQTGMIVIDNIASIFSSEVAKDSTQGYSQLISLCLRLRQMSIIHHIMVVVLNTVNKVQPTYDMPGRDVADCVPSLGRHFADLMDASLLLTVQDREIRLRILKGLRIETEQTAPFSVDCSHKISDGY